MLSFVFPVEIWAGNFGWKFSLVKNEFPLDWQNETKIEHFFLYLTKETKLTSSFGISCFLKTNWKIWIYVSFHFEWNSYQKSECLQMNIFSFFGYFWQKIFSWKPWQLWGKYWISHPFAFYPTVYLSFFHILFWITFDPMKKKPHWISHLNNFHQSN